MGESTLLLPLPWPLPSFSLKEVRSLPNNSPKTFFSVPGASGEEGGATVGFCSLDSTLGCSLDSTLDCSLDSTLDCSWASSVSSSVCSIFGDRKSTRLNSSHVRISYAVFCLKKKKKNI